MLEFVIFAFSAAIGLVLLLVFCLARHNSDTQGKKRVPGKKVPRWDKEPADPKLGDMGELASHGSLHQYLLHLHDNGRCPVTSFWWSPDLHVISLCSPEAFKDTVKLTNRPPILFKGFEPLNGAASIQFANSTDWEDRRRALFSTLKGSDLQSYFPHFVRIAQESENHWVSCEGQKLALTKEGFQISAKGITRTCFGDIFENDEEVNALAATYHNLWREMEVRIAKGDPEPGSERESSFQDNLKKFKDIVKRILNIRREGSDLSELPFIDALLQSGVPEEQIICDAVTFLVGGLHTSGYFITWLFWCLASHPAVQERLKTEIEQEVGGECGDKLRDYALKTNSYLRQVLDETLRWSTLGPWAARSSEEDMSVAGYQVPSHTPMIHALGVALLNETQWEDVDKFDPDRFGPGNPHSNRGLEFCPFGVPSRRKCPGYLFSYFEVAITTAVLLQRFVLEPAEGQGEVEKVYGLVTEPKEEIYIYARQRETGE